MNIFEIILFGTKYTILTLTDELRNYIHTAMKRKTILIILLLMTFTFSFGQDDIALSCSDDNHPHIIDLGLPSGTLWACCNVGSTSPEGYGGYYAWGETEEKTIYNLANYMHYDDWQGTYQNLGDDIAGTQYDIAHVGWGGSWVMPSHEQQEELLNNCTSQWTTNNGVYGRVYTGPSGGTIFLPAAGYRASHLYDVCNYGNYWSSTQYPSLSGYAYYLKFRSDYAHWVGYNRHLGFCVRPVISGTTKFNLSNQYEDNSAYAVYNLYGIKVADNLEQANHLPPSIYIVNGKKKVVK